MDGCRINEPWTRIRSYQNLSESIRTYQLTCNFCWSRQATPPAITGAAMDGAGLEAGAGGIGAPACNGSQISRWNEMKRDEHRECHRNFRCSRCLRQTSRECSIWTLRLPVPHSTLKRRRKIDCQLERTVNSVHGSSCHALSCFTVILWELWLNKLPLLKVPALRIYIWLPELILQSVHLCNLPNMPALSSDPAIITSNHFQYPVQGSPKSSTDSTDLSLPSLGA